MSCKLYVKLTVDPVVSVVALFVLIGLEFLVDFGSNYRSRIYSDIINIVVKYLCIRNFLEDNLVIMFEGEILAIGSSFVPFTQELFGVQFPKRSILLNYIQGRNYLTVCAGPEAI